MTESHDKSGNEDNQCEMCQDGPRRSKVDVKGETVNVCFSCRSLLEEGDRISGKEVLA